MIRFYGACLLIVVFFVSLGAAALAETGRASWYEWGVRTASRERFNPRDMTAAHRSLPFGTKVKVCILPHGKCVVVRINDRGPFVHGRIIDLAHEPARRLGILRRGVARVRVERL